MLYFVSQQTLCQTGTHEYTHMSTTSRETKQLQVFSRLRKPVSFR